MLRFNIWLRETDTSKKKGQFTCLEIQLSSPTKYSFITSKTKKKKKSKTPVKKASDNNIIEH